MPRSRITADNLRSEAQMRKVRKDGVKETSVEGYFMRQAKRYHCMQRKLSPLDGVIGWPDRILVWPVGGHTDYIELKRPKGGRYQPKQQEIQNALRERGCVVLTLHNREAVDEYFTSRARGLKVKPVAAAPRKKRAALLSAVEFLGSDDEAE